MSKIYRFAQISMAQFLAPLSFSPIVELQQPKQAKPIDHVSTP